MNNHISNLLKEQKQVELMVEKMNPTVPANYEGMIEAMRKANPAINPDNISDTVKRVMYLQLIANSVSESCKEIKQYTVDKKEIETIEEFQRSVKAFCDRLMVDMDMKENQKEFEERQMRGSQWFLKEWYKITGELSFYKEIRAYIK